MAFMDAPLAFVCLHMPPDVPTSRESGGARRIADDAKSRAARLASLMQELQKQVRAQSQRSVVSRQRDVS
jgi:uridine kinase